MKEKKSHARAPGKTSITISVEEAFRDEIDAAAAEENRNRSNYIVNLITKRLAERRAQRELEKKAPQQQPSPFSSTAVRADPALHSLNEDPPQRETATATAVVPAPRMTRARAVLRDLSKPKPPKS